MFTFTSLWDNMKRFDVRKLNMTEEKSLLKILVNWFSLAISTKEL